MVRLNVCVMDAEDVSVTRAVKGKVPATVGMPLIAPGLDKDKPDGSAPEINAQV